MGERKVLNKYYPPDFDPSIIPKRKRPKNEQIKVRMMLPMSVRCNTCGEYLYKGKKFNSRKETVSDMDYLGIKIFRFYMKCTRCSAEFTIRTDPQNADYVCEGGASRNFEPWRENQRQLDEAVAKRTAEEDGDAMRALENRTKDSKMELDILDALDEIRMMNARNAHLDTEDLIQERYKEIEDHESFLEAEDEKLVATMFKDPTRVVRRIDDDEEPSTSRLASAPKFGQVSLVEPSPASSLVEPSPASSSEGSADTKSVEKTTKPLPKPVTSANPFDLGLGLKVVVSVKKRKPADSSSSSNRSTGSKPATASAGPAASSSTTGNGESRGPVSAGGASQSDGPIQEGSNSNPLLSLASYSSSESDS